MHLLLYSDKEASERGWLCALEETSEKGSLYGQKEHLEEGGSLCLLRSFHQLSYDCLFPIFCIRCVV